ncbi:hypothetical protein MRX96_036236 [Rhipicephalus microplus]
MPSGIRRGPLRASSLATENLFVYSGQPLLHQKVTQQCFFRLIEPTALPQSTCDQLSAVTCLVPILLLAYSRDDSEDPTNPFGPCFMEGEILQQLEFHLPVAPTAF